MPKRFQFSFTRETPEQYAARSNRRRIKTFIRLYLERDWDGGNEYIRMREYAYSLGFRWDSLNKCLTYFGNQDEIDCLTSILYSLKTQESGEVAVSDAEIPLVYPALKPEQEESARWIMRRWRTGTYHGGLVADDMGIGKTLLSLTCGELALRKGIVDKLIIIAPARAMTWWRKEYEEKLSENRSIMLMNSDNIKKARYKDENNFINDMSEAEIIISNYEFLRKPAVLKRLLPFCKNSLSIFDEITDACNSTTKNYRAALSVSLASNFAIGLSGTPLSKAISQAWGVFQIVDPCIYPFREFYELHHTTKDITKWDKKTKTLCTRTVDDWKNPSLFHARVAPHFIRHVKNENNIEAIKIEKGFRLHESDSQLELKIADEINAIINRHHYKGIDWNEVEESGAQLPRWLFSALQHIESALEDPYILHFSPKYLEYLEDFKACSKNIADEENISIEEVLEDPQKVEKILSVLLSLPCGNGDMSERYTPEAVAAMEYIRKSNAREWKEYTPAKMRLIFEKMGLEDNKKKVIFCSFTRTTQRLYEKIKEHFPNTGVYLVSGEVPIKARDKIIGAFERDPSGGVLVCTDSLAFSKNLQFADILIHYNIPFRTDVWKQRSDRIYRMGATGQKTIVYIILSHPLEKRKIRIMENNLKEIKNGMGIVMSSLPEFVPIQLTGRTSYAGPGQNSITVPSEKPEVFSIEEPVKLDDYIGSRIMEPVCPELDF